MGPMAGAARRQSAGVGSCARSSFAVPGLIAALLAVLPAGAQPGGGKELPSRQPAEHAAVTAPEGAVRVAVLPFENLSGAAAPLKEIRELVRRKLVSRGAPLLDEAVLETFLREQRVRYVGGVAGEMGRALRAETGAGAVLVSSLDLYEEMDPPRIAITSRLISVGEETRILWMDSAGRTGDESPGFLGLGRITDPLTLREQVTDRITGSLARFLGAAGTRLPAPSDRARAGRRFRPTSYYRSPRLPAGRTGTARIAVLPFSNESTARRAGEIVTLQVVRHLVNAGTVEVMEPGVVREVLLRSRLIQEEGLSLPQADLLRELLGVEIVLFGEVTEYLEAGGGLEAEVDFSARAIDTARRQVIWSSSSHRRGDDRVFFFGLGRIPTAHDLASEMARGLIQTILPPERRAS